MLKSLKLASFRQHEDREFEFGPGLNAIKGPNESGKSTCLEAFTYFCFGSGALRESLDDVVTYHQPVSKLRVDCELEHLGVTYRGYRGKSGAEVSFGNEKVTGQREVTKFFERLFGASADMAGKLMFASQKSLAESLKAGPTEAGRMIEDLANFDLIDRVAESIAARRQTGNTAGVEGRVAALQAQLVEAPVEDLTALRGDIADAQEEVTSREGDLADLRERRAALDVDAAKAVASKHAAALERIEAATYEIDKVERDLAKPAVLGPADAELAAARAAVEAEKHVTRAAALRAELARLDTTELWDNDLASLEAEIKAYQHKLEVDGDLRTAAGKALVDLRAQAAEARRKADVQLAQLEGRLIKETTCALCQKDLSDVPEVARTNSSLASQIRTLKLSAEAQAVEVGGKIEAQEAIYSAAQERLAGHLDYLAQLNDVVKVNAKVEQVYARAAEFIEVERTGVPGRWRWTGPVATTGGAAANQLVHLETLVREAMSNRLARGTLQGQLESLRKSRQADIAARDALDLPAAKQVLEQAGDLDQEIRNVAAQLFSYQGVLQGLQSTLATKEALAAQAQRQIEQTRTQLAAAEAELAAMQKYNLLIKKVRAARPVITNKLWNIVLGGVSKHFSGVRGQVSNVTRADGIFKCNGFPVSGLSGSAEDMLGLAMRIALTRTFLPGADFLQLDEPGSACSDVREVKMLGMLSALNFGQIIMVTHSDLVDSYADRIITV